MREEGKEEEKRKSGALLCTGISRRVGSLLVCVSGRMSPSRVRVYKKLERREIEGERERGKRD